MKILVADKYPENGLAALRELGCEVRYEPEASGDALATLLRDSGAGVLVVRGNKVSGAALAASRLSLVVRAGAGYNTIDVAKASELGIYVSNCPGKNSAAVAELAFGLILALDRRIADNVGDLRAGKWNKKEYGKARGLKGRTLGLIGMGAIGKEMAALGRAFGMPVVAWSRSLTATAATGLGVAWADSPENVAAAADVLSVHLALTAETRGRIGASVFAALRPGSIFINTARGEVVDYAALEGAIQEKGIRAGLDVFANEPAAGTGEFADPIVKHAGVYGTHHIGASTDQAQDAISEETARIVRVFKETGRVPNCVNLAKHTPASHSLVVRHRDRPGVLAHVLTELKSAGINVQEMENIVFDGARAAIARIHLDQAPVAPVLQSIGANPDIYDLTLIPLES